MPFDDTFRNDLNEIIDDLIGPLQADGLVFVEVQSVKWFTTTKTGGRQSAGIPPTAVPVAHVLDNPIPEVKIKTIKRWRDGALIEIGNATIRISRRSMTRAQIDSVEWFELDGVKYTPVDGELETGDFEWILILKES